MMAVGGEGGRDVDEIRAGLALIISRYNDFPSLIQESTRGVGREVVVNELRQEAERQGVGVEEVARGVVVRQVRSLTTHLHQTPVDDTSQNAVVCGLLSTLKELVCGGVVDAGILGEALLGEPLLLSLPLNTLWKLSCTGVLSLEQLILRLHREKNTEHCISLVTELLNLALFRTPAAARHPSEAASVVRDVLAALVSMTHDPIPQQARRSFPPCAPSHDPGSKISAYGSSKDTASQSKLAMGSSQPLRSSPSTSREPSKYSVNQSEYPVDQPHPPASALWGVQRQEEDCYEELRVYAGEVLRSLTEGMVDYILENDVEIFVSTDDDRGGTNETRKEEESETRSTSPSGEKKRRIEHETDKVKCSYTRAKISIKGGARKTDSVRKSIHVGEPSREDQMSGHGRKISMIQTEEMTNTDVGEAQTQAKGPMMTNVYALLTNNLSVGKQPLIDYCSSQLVQILTHSPDLELALVLTRQDKWRSTRTNTALASLLRKLVVVLGCASSVETLERVVSNEEVNWGCVLTLVATLVTAHHAAIPLLKDMIERNIRRGCEEQEMEALVVGLLFARHASQEGPHVFPSYAQWFGALFSTEAASPIANKQAFVFMVRFLTNLVPHEPAHCLRAHLTSHIFTPRGCQEILQGYSYLARARLQELRDALDTTSASLQSSAAKSKAVSEEVETAVRQYGESGRIPNQVLEAAVFREAHFRTAFLPALLTPRPLPATPDARSQLIDALHKRGKVTTTMLQQYTQACQQEAAQLLAGVFEDADDDVVMEEPITELSHMLYQLMGAWESETRNESGGEMDNKPRGETGNEMKGESTILPILSRVANKLEDMMRIGDARLREVESLSLDVRAFDDRLQAYQVVEKLLETVNRGCEGRQRAWWVGQLVVLVSGSPTLQRALYTRLLHPLLNPLHPHQAQTESKTQGIVLCEIGTVEAIFLPVTLASNPSTAPQPFTTLYLTQLNLSSPHAQHFSCSVLSKWVLWHMSSEESGDGSQATLQSSLPPRLHHLYLCLAPRIPLICPQDDEREVSVGDVYNYFQGRGDVPECSCLYFTTLLHNGHAKVPLDVWMKFELEADWGDTAISVRQAYLSYWATHHVSLDTSPHIHTQGPHEETQHQYREDSHTHRETKTTREVTDDPTQGQLVGEMVFALLETGLKKANSNDLLLLLQTLGQERVSVLDPCLLEVWYKRFTASLMSPSHLPSFMSVCRCLPPSYFLNGEKLEELAPLLTVLIGHLSGVSGEVSIRESDAVFLCVCLLCAAASHPDVTNTHLSLCLHPLRPVIVYHWEAVRSVIERKRNMVASYECVNSLVNTLTRLTPTSITSLSPTEAGLRLLALCLRRDEHKGEESGKESEKHQEERGREKEKQKERREREKRNFTPGIEEEMEWEDNKEEEVKEGRRKRKKEEEEKWQALLRAAGGSSEYLKTLLAYLGIEQANGNVPLFPDTNLKLCVQEGNPLLFPQSQNSASVQKNLSEKNGRQGIYFPEMAEKNGRNILERNDENGRYFSEDEPTPRNTVSAKNLRVILESVQQLRKLTETNRAATLGQHLLPGSEEQNLAQKLVPVACVAVVLCSLADLGDVGVSGGVSVDGNKEQQHSDTIVVNQFDILLQCLIHLNQVVDGQAPQDTASSSNKLCRRPSTSRPSQSPFLPDLDYLTRLSREVMSLLPNQPHRVLSRIPKSTLLRCESELRSAVYVCLQRSEKR